MFVRVNFDQPVSNLVREFLTEDATQTISTEPAIDVTESEDESVVVVELPGVKKDDIKISVENGWLNVRGERKSIDVPDKARVVHNEITYKPFARSVRLPDHVDTNRISAQLENGLLKISLPKAEENKPRTIEIK